MKIMIVCSTAFYDKVEDVKNTLEGMGYEISLPNCYEEKDNWFPEFKDDSEYTVFFREMFHESRSKVSEVDAIVVLNYTKEKNGKSLVNYIGASTFLEMYEAFMNGKKIFMMNGFPDNMLIDEIKGFAPIIIDGDLSKVN